MNIAPDLASLPTSVSDTHTPDQIAVAFNKPRIAETIRQTLLALAGRYTHHLAGLLDAVAIRRLRGAPKLIADGLHLVMVRLLWMAPLPAGNSTAHAGAYRLPGPWR